MHKLLQSAHFQTQRKQCSVHYVHSAVQCSPQCKCTTVPSIKVNYNAVHNSRGKIIGTLRNTGQNVWGESNKIFGKDQTNN